MRQRLCILALLGVFAVSAIACSDYSGRKPPAAVRGVLDLTAKETVWDFFADGPLVLNGEWAFFWRKFISEAEFRSGKVIPDTFMPATRSWQTGTIGSQAITGQGYATYSLKILVPAAENHGMSIKIPGADTAYALYANGTLIGANGAVGADQRASIPAYLPTISQPFNAQKEITLIYQISNFHHRQGGPVEPLLIGHTAQIVRERTVLLTRDVFIAGCIFVMALYHLILFGLRRKEYSLLYFSLFCLFVSVRTTLTNESIFRYLMPQYTIEVYKIEYLAAFLAYIFFALYVHAIFRSLSSKLLLGIFLAIGIFLCLVVVFFPLIIYSHTSGWFQYTVIPSLFYWAYLGVRAYGQQKQDALIFEGGLAFLAVVIINDTLKNQSQITSIYLLQYGVMVFLIAQSVLLSLRYARTFTRVEVLSHELETANRALQTRNEALLRLQKVKDEFLSNVSHEMRTPLAEILMNLEFLNDATIAPEAREAAAANVQDGGRRLNALIERMILSTELETVGAEARLEPVSVRDMLQTVVDDLKTDFPNMIINLPTADYRLSSDRRLLHVLFWEILGNAAVFAHGQADVSVEREDFALKISVRDNGPGIPASFLASIGKKFARADQSITYQKSGTGLGLFLAARIIELLKGEIRFCNAPGGGLLVDIALPLETNGA